MIDEEFGPFGAAALALLNALSLETYEFVVIVSPSFGDDGTANIKPQFSSRNFSVISPTQTGLETFKFTIDANEPFAGKDLELLLDRFRFEHAILLSSDMGILTAWARAEYAVMAFKKEILEQHADWLERMNAMGVVRQVPGNLQVHC